jgi:hypothetical protein
VLVALASQRRKTCGILAVKPERGRILKYTGYSEKIILKWSLIK